MNLMSRGRHESAIHPVADADGSDGIIAAHLDRQDAWRHRLLGEASPDVASLESVSQFKPREAASVLRRVGRFAIDQVLVDQSNWLQHVAEMMSELGKRHGFSPDARVHAFSLMHTPLVRAGVHAAFAIAHPTGEETLTTIALTNPDFTPVQPSDLIRGLPNLHFAHPALNHRSCIAAAAELTLQADAYLRGAAHREGQVSVRTSSLMPALMSH